MKQNTQKAHSHAASTASKTPKWQLFAPPFILAALSAIFYYASLYYAFQFDDLANITKTFSIRSAKFSDLFMNGARWISYWLNAINYSFGKFNPFGYRLLNVTIHTTTSILTFYFFYLALTQLKKKSFFKDNAFLIAFTTAGLFLLHPVQTQTVSYVIQGRLEGTAGLCIMIMSVLFLLITRSKNMLAKTALTGALFIVAFFATGTKEIVIISPFLIMLIDWFFVAQGDWQEFKGRLALHGALFVMIWGTYLYYLKPKFFTDLIGLKLEARNNIGNVLTERQSDRIKPLHYFISQFKVILHYITMFIWPFNISIEYDWKMVKDFFAPDCILPFIVLVAMAYGIYAILRRNAISIIGFAALWFFVAILPRSSIIPSSELLTDYKTYVGSVGILFLLAALLVKCCQLALAGVKTASCGEHKVAIQYAVIVLLLLPVGYATYERNKVWRSNLEFWQNIVQNAPGKARAYNNLAVAMSERGQFQESIPLYQKAIEMDDLYPDPCNNLAVAYSFLGETDKAIAAIKRGIKIQPHYPEAYNNLASFLITKKDFDNAQIALEHAIKLRPHYGKAYFNLGKIALEKNNAEKAHEYFKMACLKADLDNESGFKVYGNISMNLKKYEDAIVAYTKLYEIQPTIEVALNLGNAYYNNQQYSHAVALYQNIVKHNPKDPNVLYNMGECYVQLQQPQEAVVCFSKARELNPTMPNIPMRMALCYEQLKQYDKARETLESVLAQQNMPENFKALAKTTLAQMDKPTQKAAAAA